MLGQRRKRETQQTPNLWPPSATLAKDWVFVGFLVVFSFYLAKNRHAVWAVDPCTSEHVHVWSRPKSALYHVYSLPSFSTNYIHLTITFLAIEDSVNYKTARHTPMDRASRKNDWVFNLVYKCIPGPVFSYKLRYIVGFWLVEMAISTNQKPTIYRNLYENTAPVPWVQVLNSYTGAS